SHVLKFDLQAPTRRRLMYCIIFDAAKIRGEIRAKVYGPATLHGVRSPYLGLRRSDGSGRAHARPAARAVCCIVSPHVLIVEGLVRLLKADRLKGGGIKPGGRS